MFLLNSQPFKILAIIPCYNESKAIGRLLEEFRALPFSISTLVVDDGSYDNTADIARYYSPVVSLNKNSGLSNAIHTGIHYALNHNYDYCIQIDGDGQHVPAEIARFMAVLPYSRVNLYIGSRYTGHVINRRLLMPRRMAGFIVSCFIRLLYEKWIYDPLSGMRMMDKKAMEFFDAKLMQNILDSEIVPYALREGFSIQEVPVNMRERCSGVSYLRGFTGIKFLLRLLVRMLFIRMGK